MMAIRVFEEDSKEYKKLEMMATVLTLKSPLHRNYVVGETYFDLGQGWKWTTVLCANGNDFGGYQALTPVDQEAVLRSDGSLEAINNIANAVLSDKYCPDRIREKV